MTPIDITLHQSSRLLEITFEAEDGSKTNYKLPFEFLRVHSPSAEVQGHAPSQAVLQTGKRGVNLVGAEPVGHYALKLSFDDGHDSGLFTWRFFQECGQNYNAMWQTYLDKLSRAGASRD